MSADVEWVRHPTGADTPRQQKDDSNTRGRILGRRMSCPPQQWEAGGAQNRWRVANVACVCALSVAGLVPECGFPTSGIPQRNRRCVTDHFWMRWQRIWSPRHRNCRFSAEFVRDDETPLSRCGVVLVTNKSRCRVARPSHVVLEFAVNRGTITILSTFLLKKATKQFL